MSPDCENGLEKFRGAAGPSDEVGENGSLELPKAIHFQTRPGNHPSAPLSWSMLFYHMPRTGGQ